MRLELMPDDVAAIILERFKPTGHAVEFRVGTDFSYRFGSYGQPVLVAAVVTPKPPDEPTIVEGPGQ